MIIWYCAIFCSVKELYQQQVQANIKAFLPLKPSHCWLVSGERGDPERWYLLPPGDRSVAGVLCSPGQIHGLQQRCSHSWIPIQWETAPTEVCIRQYFSSSGKWFFTDDWQVYFDLFYYEVHAVFLQSITKHEIIERKWYNLELLWQWDELQYIQMAIDIIMLKWLSKVNQLCNVFNSAVKQLCWKH